MGSFMEGRSPPATKLDFWLPIYAAGLVFTGIATYYRSVLAMAIMGVNAARRIYVKLSKSVMVAPMIFFESNPSGRIVNRFTKDTEALDFQILMTFQQWFNCVFAILGSLALIALINPWFLSLLPALIVIYLSVYMYVRALTTAPPTVPPSVQRASAHHGAPLPRFPPIPHRYSEGATRDLKRMDSVSSSPIFSQVMIADCR